MKTVRAPLPRAVLKLQESTYGMLGISGNVLEVKSGLRKAVLPGMLTFIDRVPAEAVVVSIDQAPPVPPEIDQPVGVPEPDSKEPLETRFGSDADASR